MIKRITKIAFSFFAFLISLNFVQAQDPFWTESFDSALPAEWTALEAAGDGTPTANWFWTNVGSTGLFSIGALASTSADNGWMIFDSDLNCSGSQDAWLISPELDLTDKDVVVLQFETLYRKFNDDVSIQVSTDNMNWEEIVLFGDLGNNDFSSDLNPHTVNIILTEYAANQESFWFAFRFLSNGANGGCGYSWQIDDVALLDVDPTPPNDLELTHTFYSPGSFATPISQIDTDTIGFFGYVTNNGSAEATDVWLKAEVLNDAGEVLFADSIMEASIAVGDVDTLDIADFFVANDPGLYPVGDYTIAYSVWSAGNDDAIPDDNATQALFTITDNTWSKEAGANNFFGPQTLDDRIDGNLYIASSNLLENEYEFTQTQFAAEVDGGIDGRLANVLLLEVDENTIASNWDGFDFDTEPVANEGLIIKSFIPHTFTGANGEMQTADITDFDTGNPGVTLKPGNRYIIGVSYEGANNDIDHGYSTVFENPDVISSVLFFAADGWFLGGWADGPAAVIRMNIDLISTIDETPLPAGAMEIFPNPVSDQLTLNVDLEEIGLANVVIADLAGKIIQLHEYPDLKDGNFQYNVSNLANGTYLIRLATESGTRTMKFIVQK